MYENMGSAVFTLIVIIAVIYLSYIFSKFIGKRGFGSGNRSGYMRVLDRITLGKDSALAIVQVGEKHYLVGISSTGISVLSELDKEDLRTWKGNSETKSEFPQDFKAIMEKMKNLKNWKN